VAVQDWNLFLEGIFEFVKYGKGKAAALWWMWDKRKKKTRFERDSG
jgi:hypothetical protein